MTFKGDSGTRGKYQGQDVDRNLQSSVISRSYLREKKLLIIKYETQKYLEEENF